MSPTSNSGSSIAAKCPPRGISVQRWTLKKRAAHSRAVNRLLHVRRDESPWATYATLGGTYNLG